MSAPIVIRTENLGKRYSRGRQRVLSTSFRELLYSIPGRLAAKARGSRNQPATEVASDKFWALRHLNLEIRRSELVGFIGHNGAGKSTLLRVLSRITLPTEGRAWLRGRVRSLLEVGTGFHPELTGRENIYLNGVVLGMRKREIDRKFDEIVSFAEIRDFLDTPVKRYSTGMYVRLGFSVAAHLEPEILLVDEVLAVGDARFQKRCLGKIENVSQEGRTVILVSHNMQMIRRLCNRTLWIDHGEIKADGKTTDVVPAYLSSISRHQTSQDFQIADHSVHRNKVDILRVDYTDNEGQLLSSIMVDQPFYFRVEFRVRDPSERYKIDLILKSPEGLLAASLFSLNDGLPLIEGEAGQHMTLQCRSRNIFLGGNYSLDVCVRTADGTIVAQIEGIDFQIESVSVERSVELTPGLVRLDAEWSLERDVSNDSRASRSAS